VLLNAGPLIVRGLEGAAAAGLLFNVLMVARAPQVLFQAVTTSLLPNLTRLWTGRTREGRAAFQLSVRSTLVAVLGFAIAVGVVILVAGPALMRLAFGESFSYQRADLLIVAVGMGFHLASLTLNQAALAQGQAREAAVRWLVCAAAFLAWSFVPVLDEVRRVEVGFAGAAALLCALLYLVYRRPSPRHPAALIVDPSQPAALQLPAADEAG
jgi:O-antigen/teichoic acid export membrane protein